VRIGFLGAGLIATYHSKSLRASGVDCTWAAVYDPDRARAERFAAATGSAVAEGEEEVVDRADALYVCTWTSEHPRLVELATQAGKAVFCEKPLAVDLARARAMHNAVAQAGVVNQVGLVLRASPAFNALALRLADTDATGRVMAVVFRDDQYIPVQGMYGSTWRGEAAKAGAGCLLEHSIHDVDVLSWLLGPVAQVSARQAGFHGIPGIEDVVAATLTYESGVTASLVSVWHDVLSRPSLRLVEVHCERAWFSLEGDWAGPLRVMTSDGAEVLEGDKLPTPPNPDRAFVEAAREGRPAFPDFAVAVQANEVVEALYQSAAAGGAQVALPLGAQGCDAASAAT
jgi:predicted dehydrogenase